MFREHSVDLKALQNALGCGMISGLVVEGALAIDGALVNAALEYGAFLIVAGSFEARAVSGGGAEIRIEGPAHVRDTVIGHYNDGILHFSGGLTARMLVNDNHDLFVTGPLNVDIRWDSHTDSRNELLHAYPQACGNDDDVADVLPIVIAQRVTPDFDRWDRLKWAMIAGAPVLVDKAAPRTEPGDLGRISAGWDRLRLVAEEERSDALCDAAIAGSGFALLYCPREKWSPERVFVAVDQSPDLLHGIVPFELITSDMALRAAMRLGFDGLPHVLKTDDLLIAVLDAAKSEADLKTLSALPAKYVTMAVLPHIRRIYGAHARYAQLEAARSCVRKTDPFYLLTEIWQAFLTEADVIRGLNESGNAEAIHPSAMTPAVCDAMIAYRGSNLALLPRDKITDPHVDLALSRDGAYLAYVPADMRTPERCLIAVESSGLALEYVPEALITDDICERAVADDGRALEYVPLAMRSEALCRRALAHPHPPDMDHVPEPLRNAVERDPAGAS